MAEVADPQLRVENPWTELPDTPPFVLRSDASYLTPELASWAKLRLDHVPVPFIGDPRSASVVLLGLNPGWVPETDLGERGDYAEQNRLCIAYSSRVPFFSLDPALAGTPGGRWWRRRLRLLIEDCGLDLVSRRIACVEWFPYHSAAFRRLPVLIPSQKYGFDLVRGALQRRAVIVMMRSRDLWLSAVPELKTQGFLSLRVPRSAYLTATNIDKPDGYATVVGALRDSR